MDAANRPLSFLGNPPSAAFSFRHIALAPGYERWSGVNDWQDTLVLVERGAVEVECANGALARFTSGDVLSLCRMPPLLIRNPQLAAATVLSAVSRNRLPDR